MSLTSSSSFVVLDTAATLRADEDSEIHGQVAVRNGKPVADFRLFMRAKRNGKFYRSRYGFSVAPHQLDGLERLVRSTRAAFDIGTEA